MGQIGAAGQGAQIGNGSLLNLQILQLGAVGQGAQVADVGHGNDQHLQLRHGGDKAQVAEIVIVAQVKVFQFGAVLQHGAIIDHAAHRGLGGQDPLRIRADAVILAKPDAPDYIHTGVFLPDGCHGLVGHPAVVHVQIGAVFHKGQNLPDGGALVVNGGVVEVQTFRIQAQLLPIEGEAVIQLCLGAGLRQKENLFPAQTIGPFAAQFDLLQVCQTGQYRRRILRLIRRQGAEIQLLHIRRHALAQERKAEVKVSIGQGASQGGSVGKADGRAFTHGSQLHLAQPGQGLQRLTQLVNIPRRQGGQVYGCGVVAILAAVRQGDRVLHQNRGVGLGPGGNLLIAGTAAEVRRRQVPEQGQGLRLAALQHRRQLPGVRRVTAGGELHLHRAKQRLHAAVRLMVRPGQAQQDQQSHQCHANHCLYDSLCSHPYASRPPTVIHLI